MQYAEIIIKSRTSFNNQIFTYEIPPQMLSEIKIGCLVEIPFGNRIVEGIIWNLKKHSNIKSLKKIKRIITPFPIINDLQKSLAIWMSKYYLEPLGKCLFTILPPIPKRLAAKIPSIKNPPSIKKSKKYFFSGSREERFEVYKKIILKHPSGKILIIFPDIDYLNKFKKIIQPYNLKVICQEKEISSHKRFDEWFKVLTQNPNLILGTRSAIFNPIFDLKWIIIDEPSHFSHKQEQSPRYHVLKIAQRISELSGSGLITADNLPPLELYLALKEKKYFRIKNPTPQAPGPKIKIIDLRGEKTLISFSLENEIRTALAKNKSILIYATRRGSGTSAICKDCGNVKLCPRCNLPLIPYTQTKKLVCHQCHHQQRENLICEKCGGTNIRYSGIGIEKIKELCEKLFGKNKNITIETKRILSEEKKYDLVAIISIDALLNLPDPLILEEIFQTLSRLKSAAKESLIIQSYFVDNPIFQSLNHPNQFLEKELQKRFREKLPPYYRLIKIISQNKSEEDAVAKIKKLDAEIQDSRLEIMGPTKSFIYQKRDNFYYQLIIKVPFNFNYFEYLSNLKSFNANFKIDVDPLTLL